jgi:hypothetical protein
MGMHEISQKLAYMTKPNTWEPVGDFTEAELTRLRFDAANELRNSAFGQQLLARGGPYIFDDVLEEFGRRVKAPSISPFVETLVQVARDILVTLPVENSEEYVPVTDPREEQRRTNALAAQDAKRDERAKHLRKFSHMVNAALAYEGPKCLKPRDGFIRLKFEENGKPYEYKYKYGNADGKRDLAGNLFTSPEYDEFMRNFEEACAKGLIDR